MSTLDLADYVQHIVKGLQQAQWNHTPFGHAVIDNFLPETIAADAADYCESLISLDFTYDSPIERKQAHNQWNTLPPTIYGLMAGMNHHSITVQMQTLTEMPDIFLDAGLHGGGIHRTPTGGHLNLHIDYAIHPKLNAERRLNLIIYLNRDWQEDWGGDLTLWSGNGRPETLFAQIKPTYNRAVIFATGDNSWHGFPEPVTCPPDRSRVSLAMYYCSLPQPDTEKRYKARFVPSKSQRHDDDVQQLCNARESLHTADRSYRVTL